ncbi:vitellogenin-like [Carcharodon carcharias]|uniref:vitellogenin-like n=1 Tax=Carcharodon carcharias TaxID=13397 RepID=UPI001B7E2F0E|nr:vitellogenin-like [Carcharodon carcharias]
MRGIIFALAFALVGNQQYGPSFSHSKTYVYQYEGVVLTGLPENGLAKGGLKITSKLQISSIDQRNHLLKIISPQIQEYSGTWPKAQFIPARKLTRKLSAQLSKPIEFEYSHGRVGNIYTHPDLPENILNIHRGILNMLQISIKKSQNIYELQENGVEGICQANYVIQENKKSGFITVTKSKDLNKCQEKISETKGAAYSQPCETCQLKGKSLRSVATYSYAIKNTKDVAVIVEVVSKETHQFTPFNERDGAASTESRQHLVFLEYKNQSPPVPTEHLEKRGTLRYQFSNELLQIPLLLVKPSYNDTNKIITTLENLVQMNRERAHPDAPMKFLQLIQLLRSATLENLQSIWEKGAGSSHHRCWIWDTLPTAATPEAIQFIQTKIEQGELQREEAAKALIFVLHSIKADCHGVDNATVLLSSPYMQRDPFLRRVTLLAYGTLVHKYCAALRVCPDEALQPLHKLVVEAGSGDNEEQTILGLKAIGNAGQVASLKRIQKLLPGFGNVASSVSNRIHGEAVMALRNIAKKEPRKVQAITLQLFMNKRIHAELRMRAFIVLMETKPSLALIASVTDSLVRETNLQVTSFGYSYMKSLAESSAPELQSLAASCNLAVKRLNQKCSTLSYRYSKGLHFGAFKDKLLAGVDANVYLIKKSEGILPTTAIANFKVYGLGVSSDFLEVANFVSNSVIEQGLFKFLLLSFQVLEWKSIPIIKPQAVAYIRLFGQELAFAEFRQKDLQEVSKAWTMPFNWILPLKKGKIERLLKEFIEMLQSGLTVHWTKPWLASEIRHIVPTLLGLPLEIAFYYTVVTVVHAKVKITLSPSNLTMAQLLNTSIQADVQFTASFASYIIASQYLHFIAFPFSSVKDVIAIMGISTPLVQAGVAAQLKTNTVASVNFAAEVNIDKGNIKIETHAWKQEDQLFFARLWAFAFTRNIEDLAAEKVTPLVSRGGFGIMSRELSLAKNSTVDREGVLEKVLPLAVPRESLCSAEDTPDVPSPTVRQTCVKSSTFGVEICYKTSTENAVSATDSLLYKLVGDKSVEVTIRPVNTPIAIKKLQLELCLNEEDQLSARVSDLMRKSNRSELTLPEGKLTLLKFKKIFNGRRWQETQQQLPEIWFGTTLQQSNFHPFRHQLNPLRQDVPLVPPVVLAIDCNCLCKGVVLLLKPKLCVEHGIPGHPRPQAPGFCTLCPPLSRAFLSWTDPSATDCKHLMCYHLDCKHLMCYHLDCKHLMCYHLDCKHLMCYYLDCKHLMCYHLDCKHLMCYHLDCKHLMCYHLDCKHLMCYHLDCKHLMCYHLDCKHLMCYHLDCKHLMCYHLDCKHLMCYHLDCKHLMCYHLDCKPLMCYHLDCKHLMCYHLDCKHLMCYHLDCKHLMCYHLDCKHLMCYHLDCKHLMCYHLDCKHLMCYHLDCKHLMCYHLDCKHLMCYHLDCKHLMCYHLDCKHLMCYHLDCKHLMCYHLDCKHLMCYHLDCKHLMCYHLDCKHLMCYHLDCKHLMCYYLDCKHLMCYHLDCKHLMCYHLDCKHLMCYHLDCKHLMCYHLDCKHLMCYHLDCKHLMCYHLDCKHLMCYHLDFKLYMCTFQNVFNEHSTHLQHGSSSSLTHHSITSSSSSSKSEEEDGARPCKGSSRKSSDLQSSSRSSSSSSKSSSRSRMSSSSSSSYSPSSSSQQVHHNSVPPKFVLLTRAILTDNKEKGYLTKAYMDSSMEQRALQVFVDELQEGGSWRACIAAEMPDVHRAVASLKWGKNCQDYKIAAKASTGHFEHYPAVLVKAKWGKLPQTLKETAGIVADKLAGIAFTLGFSERHRKSPAHQISVVTAATSQQTLNVVVKTPKVFLISLTFPLQIFSPRQLSMPNEVSHGPLSSVSNSGHRLREDVKALETIQRRLTRIVLGTIDFSSLKRLEKLELFSLEQRLRDDLIDMFKIIRGFAECTVMQNHFTPFTKDSFEYQMPEGCAHVLVQDCTPELKFILLIRHSAESLFVQLNCPSSAIEMQSTKTGEIQLFVNGTKISITSLPFTGPKSLVIERSENGVRIKAPGLGLEKLFFSVSLIQVTVLPWMAETTCGLCGRSDSQRSTEYPQPNKRSTNEILKFAHSWLLPGENCTDACKLMKTTLRLDNTVNIHGQESKCYTVDPVLRCQAICSPVKTAPVVYGFHCLPADSHANPSDEQLISANFGQKSEDLTGTVEAHTACSCPSECN